MKYKLEYEGEAQWIEQIFEVRNTKDFLWLSFEMEVKHPDILKSILISHDPNNPEMDRWTDYTFHIQRGDCTTHIPNGQENLTYDIHILVLLDEDYAQCFHSASRYTLDVVIARINRHKLIWERDTQAEGSNE